MQMPLIIKNALYLLSSNVLVRFISAVTTIFVARYLGPREYGMLGVAFALAGVLAFFTDLGLNHTIIREVTRPEARADELFSSLLKTKILLTVATAAAGITFTFIFYPSPVLRTVVLWITIPTIIGTSLDSIGATYFQSTQQMKFTALSKGISGVSSTLFLIVGLVFHWSVFFIAAVYGFTSVLTGLISFGMTVPRLNLLKGWNRSMLDDLFSFALGGFVVMMLPLLGPIVLEKVTTLTQVGYFSGAYRIPSLLYQIPGVVAAAFYPKLFEHGNRLEYDAHKNLTIQEIKLMSAAGILLSLPFIIYPYWIMSVIFGHQWGATASRTLTLLSVVVILQSVNFPMSDALTTKGLQSRRTLVLIVDLLIGVGAYVYFGHTFGSLGGGIAVVVIEGTLTVGLTLLNPVGPAVLFKGLKSSVPALALGLLFGLSLKHWIYPPIGMIVSISVSILALLLLDKDFRTKFKKKVAKRNAGLS